MPRMQQKTTFTEAFDFFRLHAAHMGFCFRVFKASIHLSVPMFWTQLAPRDLVEHLCYSWINMVMNEVPPRALDIPNLNT